MRAQVVDDRYASCVARYRYRIQIPIYRTVTCNTVGAEDHFGPRADVVIRPYKSNLKRLDKLGFNLL